MDNSSLGTYYSDDKKQIMRIDREEIVDIEDIIVNKLNFVKKDYDLIIISDYRKGVITNRVLDKIIEVSNNSKITGKGTFSLAASIENRISVGSKSG